MVQPLTFLLNGGIDNKSTSARLSMSRRDAQTLGMSKNLARIMPPIPICGSLPCALSKVVYKDRTLTLQGNRAKTTAASQRRAENDQVGHTNAMSGGLHLNRFRQI